MASTPILQYGGRRARLLRLLHGLAARAGMLRRYRSVEWERVQRLVMICKGNICRSPYAEGRARLLGFDAVSCGLACDAGAPAWPSAIAMAALRHVDLRRHRTTALTAVHFRPGDLLLAMEPSQAHRLAPVARRSGAQVGLLGLWADPPQPYIADPWGLDGAAFDACYAVIDDALVHMRSLWRPMPAPDGITATG